jgi:predicted dehydrogenase
VNPNKSSRALVIGYGSIGQRHARLLAELGVDIACVTQQFTTQCESFDSIPRALEAWNPDYVVIASPTSKHASDLSSLLDNCFQGPILVEKPLFSDVTVLNKPLPDTVFVGYNLRFHDSVQQLKLILKDQPILTVSLWNAQYLPDWRPGRDYRATSSAKKSAGGGVLRDLSHDLDLLLYLFGSTTEVYARLAHSDILEIDTEDTVLATLSIASCRTVSLYLSYLDRVPRHDIQVTTPDATIHCNLLSGEIRANASYSLHATERDDTFRRMHLAVLRGDRTTLCSVTDAMSTVATIAAIEQSSSKNIAITL